MTLHKRAFDVQPGDLLSYTGHWYLVISEVHLSNEDFMLLVFTSMHIQRWKCGYIGNAYQIFRNGEELT